MVNTNLIGAEPLILPIATFDDFRKCVLLPLENTADGVSDENVIAGSDSGLIIGLLHST